MAKLRRKAGRQAGDSAAAAGVMLVLLFFAVCSVAMLLGSAEFSRIDAKKGETAWNTRTCAQYLSWKVQQMDEAGSVSVGTLGDGDALILLETIEDTAYATWIYCSDGWIREYFAAAEEEPLCEAGTEIMEAEQLHVKAEGNLLNLQAVLTDEQQANVTIYLHSKERKAF